MMSKNNRILAFFYTVGITFFVLITTLYLYFFSKKQNNWMRELVRTKMFKLPLIFYLLVISIFISSIIMIALYLYNRHNYRKIEEKLQLLASGNYEHDLLNQAVEDNRQSAIEQDIFSIKNKMLSMSKELQVLNSLPKKVDGESKEEVIKEERQRLARELHDSVSQQLFAATMMLSTLNESVTDLGLPNVIEQQISMVTEIINTSQSEMRALLLHLRPISLESKSLKDGIEMLLNELQTKINIDLTWDIEDIVLPAAIEDNLFRIVQELLSNTLRHAKANTLEVYLRKINQILLLRVVDDGVGFDADNQKVGSYGLNNISERAINMGGTCRIVSFAGQGSSIEIKVPLVMEENQDDKNTIN